MVPIASEAVAKTTRLSPYLRILQDLVHPLEIMLPEMVEKTKKWKKRPQLKKLTVSING